MNTLSRDNVRVAPLRTLAGGLAALHTHRLPFETVAEGEVRGSEHGRLLGVFGIRARIMRLRFDDEFADLIAPQGCPISLPKHLTKMSDT